MIRAADILRAFGLGQRRAELARLDALPTDIRARIEEELSVMPADARIDVSRLVERVSRSQIEHTLAEKPEADTLSILRWRFTLLTREQLVQLRRELETARDEGQTDAGPVLETFFAKLDGVARHPRSETASPTPAASPSNRFRRLRGEIDDLLDEEEAAALEGLRRRRQMRS